MAFWGFYFLAKLVLYHRGSLNLDVLWNMAFCLFLMLPLPKKLPKFKFLSSAKSAANFILGMLLLWHDSWLSPIAETVAFMRQQGLPSKEFIFSFLTRYYSFEAVAIAVVSFFVCKFLDRFINLAPVAFVAFLGIGAWNLHDHSKVAAVKELNAMVEGFYEYESTRIVNFMPPKSGSADFDIVFIHVCSLAWDDLNALHMDQDKFFSQFQYLFANFNGVTTYSGPAAQRVLRAPCGQLRHADLYNRSADECYLFEDLKDIGYETYFALNHDGKFGNFADEIKKHARVNKPFLSREGLTMDTRMFDDSPVARDYDVLSRWSEIRQKQPSAAPAVLYYNTVTLHDGAHWASDPKWTRRDHKATYKEFLVRLLSDMTRFFELLAKSGRNVVVVFIPEHGMALKGSAIQSSGLRDIPLPSITILPVGVKFIGPKYNDAVVRKYVVKKPVSYLAIANLLKYYIEHSPFTGDLKAKTLMEELPSTEMLMENESARVMFFEGKYFYYGKDKKWVELDPSQM